jgi:hypothetical protein
MGIADSPLHGQVIFVEGAPRSGTTLLAALISCHPDVAGILSESHLFDIGVNALFDNHESSDPARIYLRAYLSREKLVGLVRDFVDGVFEEMRSKVDPQARFVLEKTPAERIRPKVTLARKLECFPDARFIHVVRDERAVTRSLLRAPWNPDRSQEASRRWWRDAVDAIRDELADQPGYREMRYDDLADDPVSAMSRLFEWLGLRHDEETMDLVALVSRERFAELAPVGQSGTVPLSDEALTVSRGLRRLPQPRLEHVRSGRAVRKLARLTEGVRTRRGRSMRRVASAFAEALREGAKDVLTELTEPSLIFELKSGEGELRTTGDPAREALLTVAARVFSKTFLSESWAFNPGRSLVTVLFTGIRGDGSRVDLAWSLVVWRGRVARVNLISAGDVGGRALRQWPHFPTTAPGAGG